jgi:glycosyltransferase involved in cell wall biosynthesis
VISESLADKLRFPRRKCHILPLGADVAESPVKSFEALHLLYVGTLNGRRIKDTLLGFARFYREFGHTMAMSYTIVGDGPRGELEELRTIALERSLSDVVELPGYIARQELDTVFARCNIGVSYVPKTPFFEVQPVTKTFEYMMAGMPVIATATYEHTLVVDETNGVLIDDNEGAFCEALKELRERHEWFDSVAIRRSCRHHSWERIVRRNLAPYLERVCKGGPARGVRRVPAHHEDRRLTRVGEKCARVGDQR